MKLQSWKLPALLVSLSIALCACASSPSQPSVGLVVEAPKVVLPPVPKLVKETPPKPTGYFQKAILDALEQ